MLTKTKPVQIVQAFNRFAQFKTYQANIRSKSSKVPVVPIVRLQSRNKPSVNVRDLVSVAISPEGRTGRTNLRNQVALFGLQLRTLPERLRLRSFEFRVSGFRFLVFSGMNDVVYLGS